MKLLKEFICGLFCFHLRGINAAPRYDVRVDGTTIKPGFIRVGGNAGTFCPSAYPVMFNGGHSCCRYAMEDTSSDPLCNGGELYTYSSCCQGGEQMQCSEKDFPCKTNMEDVPRDGVWTEWSAWGCPSGGQRYALRARTCPHQFLLCDGDAQEKDHNACGGTGEPESQESAASD